MLKGKEYPKDRLQNVLSFHPDQVGVGEMAPAERFVDYLARDLVRTAIVLKQESAHAAGVAEAVSESETLGAIVAHYENSGRKIAETAYAALDAAGLAVEALALSELWRQGNADQNDLWSTEEDDLDGK